MHLDINLIRNEASIRKYVSIIVPAYGVENYLDQCLQSLTRQTLEDIEIIVVDDGAKDRSGAIADDWARRFPGKVIAVHKENGGCASARNAGLRVATGYYVGFVDGDDWVSPHMYEDLINAALPSFCDIAQCGYREAYEDGGETLHPSLVNGNTLVSYPYVSSSPADYILNAPSIWRRIYRRNFLERQDINFPEHIKRFDDLPFAFEALSSAASVAMIPDCHYFYRLGRPGQDVSFDDERLFVHFEIFDYMYRRMSGRLDDNMLGYLARIEESSHRWAIKLLRSDLVSEYEAKVSLQIDKFATYKEESLS